MSDPQCKSSLGKITWLLGPLGESKKACLIGFVALSLLLTHLIPGSPRFFSQNLAHLWLAGSSALEIEWWATLYHFAGAFLLFLIIPAALIKVVLKQNVSEMGLGLGEKRLGFLLVAPLGLLLVALPAGLSAGAMSDFVAEYPLSKLAPTSPELFLAYQMAYGLLYYAAYEAFFRGFVQFSLRPEIGTGGAILVQTAMTTLLHLGKPEGEIVSALLAGFVFGALALRLRSVWPLVIVHWGLGLLTDLFCARAGGILFAG